MNTGQQLLTIPKQADFIHKQGEQVVRHDRKKKKHKNRKKYAVAINLQDIIPKNATGQSISQWVTSSDAQSVKNHDLSWKDSERSEMKRVDKTASEEELQIGRINDPITYGSCKVHEKMQEAMGVRRDGIDDLAGSMQPVSLNISSEEHGKASRSSWRTPTKKFKRKSEFDSKSRLESILESKSRISINGSTGKYDFQFKNHFVTTEKGQVIIAPSLDSSKQQKAVNCLFDSQGKSLEDMMPMISRPSHFVWQLPYQDRQQFIEMDTAQRISKLKTAQQVFQRQKSQHDNKTKSSNKSLHNSSAADLFRQASRGDSDFDFIDDHIDDEEECGGATRAIRYSIKCLDFHMMMAEKSLIEQISKSSSSGKKASLLSRASSLMANAKQGEVRPSLMSIKQFNDVNRILQQYMQDLPPSQRRISSNKSLETSQNMTNIDEREECERVQCFNATYQCSMVHSYKMDTFFTPNQQAKQAITAETCKFKSPIMTGSERKPQPQEFETQSTVKMRYHHQDSGCGPKKLDFQRAQQISKDHPVIEEEDIQQEDSNSSKVLELVKQNSSSQSNQSNAQTQSNDRELFQRFCAPFGEGDEKENVDSPIKIHGRKSQHSKQLAHSSKSTMKLLKTSSSQQKKSMSKVTTQSYKLSPDQMQEELNISPPRSPTKQNPSAFEHVDLTKSSMKQVLNQNSSEGEEFTEERFVETTAQKMRNPIAQTNSSQLMSQDKQEKVDQSRNASGELSCKQENRMSRVEALKERTPPPRGYPQVSVDKVTDGRSSTAEMLPHTPSEAQVPQFWAKQQSHPNNKSTNSIKEEHHITNNQVSCFDAIDDQFLKTKEAELKDKEAEAKNSLSAFVTKMAEEQDTQQEAGPVLEQQQDLHKQHFLQTIQALQNISQNIKIVDSAKPQYVELPPPRFPKSQKKLLIFDMDETLIHCVDDVEKQETDIILEIDFPDDETVYAGINIRPYVIECLVEASKNYQVIVFTASHQIYADAILDYIDPTKELIQHRLYRQHCTLTPGGYYVKDLRIINPEQFDLSKIVIVDNSVYSFAFHIDNGIPIVPFYRDKSDEEMLHLVYYLNCLGDVADVREQNRQAFELFKLQNQEALDSSFSKQQDNTRIFGEPIEPSLEESSKGDSLPEVRGFEDADKTIEQEKEEATGTRHSQEIGKSSNDKFINIQNFISDHTFRNLEQHTHRTAEDDILKDTCQIEVPSLKNATELENSAITDQISGYGAAKDEEAATQPHQYAQELQPQQNTRQLDLEAVLKDIYRNLIDEEDIIVEEESRDAVSHTASISEIQLLQHHSNYSNNTGYEIQKLVKLMKNNSCSSLKQQTVQKSNSYNQSFPSGQDSSRVLPQDAKSQRPLYSQKPSNESRGSGDQLHHIQDSDGLGTIGQAASLASMPPVYTMGSIQADSNPVGSLPQSGSNKKRIHEQRQDSYKTCEQFRIGEMDQQLEMAGDLELQNSVSKKSHRQITEKLESVQMKRSTSKTTKKNALKSSTLENLHIDIIRFEDQGGQNVNEYLADGDQEEDGIRLKQRITTPKDEKIDHQFDRLEHNLQPEAQQRDSPEAAKKNIQKPNLGAGPSVASSKGKSQERDRRSRLDRTAARKFLNKELGDSAKFSSHNASNSMTFSNQAQSKKNDKYMTIHGVSNFMKPDQCQDVHLHDGAKAPVTPARYPSSGKTSLLTFQCPSRSIVSQSQSPGLILSHSASSRRGEEPDSRRSLEAVHLAPVPLLQSHKALNPFQAPE